MNNYHKPSTNPVAKTFELEPFVLYLVIVSAAWKIICYDTVRLK